MCTSTSVRGSGRGGGSSSSSSVIVVVPNGLVGGPCACSLHDKVPSSLHFTSYWLVKQVALVEGFPERCPEDLLEGFSERF